MTDRVIPYPDLGVASFEVLDNWTQSFLFAGASPKALVFSGFQAEENQVLAIHTVVGLNARHKLVPATVSGDTVTHFVSKATLVAPGSGGTDGAAVLTGATGTGTKFQVNATVLGGIITALGSLVVEGSYTVNPTDLTAEPLVGPGSGPGHSLTGATVAITMEQNEVVTEGIVALGVTAIALTTAIGDDSESLPIYFQGNFNKNHLVFDSSFTDDAEKYRAFQGAPSPTQITVGDRPGGN